MRRLMSWVLPLLVLMAALSSAGTSFATESSPTAASKRTIDVTGRGSVEAKPDTAVITLGVTALEPSPSAAYRAAGKSMAGIADALRALGVKDDQIKTDQLNLGAEYNWTQEQGQVLKGYRASSNIAITTQKLDQVAALIEAAVGAGSNTLQSVVYSVKDSQALVDQAMEMAADNAREKASRVAKRMGTSVGDVIRITVQDESAPPPRPMAAEMKSVAGAAMPVFAGTQNITVSISASFELK